MNAYATGRMAVACSALNRQCVSAATATCGVLLTAGCSWRVVGAIFGKSYSVTLRRCVVPVLSCSNTPHRIKYNKLHTAPSRMSYTPSMLDQTVASGWDKIDGGTCTHAWRILTGCEEQYTFKQSGGLFKAFGAFNPNQNKMEELENSPHDGFAALWPMKWPEVPISAV